MENTWKVVEMRNRSDRNRKGDCEPAEASRISEGRKGLRRMKDNGRKRSVCAWVEGVSGLGLP